jgi:hypothetical protein
MSFKIKGGLLIDDNFMQSFAAVMEGISLPYQVAFKLFKLGNELGLAAKDLDEKKQFILESHAKKNNDGRFIMKDGGFSFSKVNEGKVKEAMVELFSKDVELNCDPLDLQDLEKGVMKPNLIRSMAMIHPLTKK